ncbi:hypothetical protein FSW04_01450 [Baekduia soli]|uniref:Cellulase family glycosylhydrolase n=1 Tax=Baekduia soli TaxID=496014 RepID=A0A5B8U074_9ACTN|nr:hypothetical protein [Baekduia soli]QEC46374.1 hypothetical protein FSW04_01450 [Baekduia soli]
MLGRLLSQWSNLRLAVLLAALAALMVAGCGAGDQARRATTPAPPAISAAPPETTTSPTPVLAVGITESNPHLLAPGPQPTGFGPWRDRLVALKPAYVRVLVDWARLQPTQGLAPNAEIPSDGCMRGQAPCAPYAGLRDTLRAVAALGAEPVLVLFGTPRWAARRVAGCERPGTTSYQRMPDLDAYRAFVRWLLALGRSLKVDLPWWSAWNEPNAPGFLNPQRTGCGDDRAPPRSPGLYAQIVQALADELDEAPGAQRLVLGDTAGVPEGRPKAVGSAEFVRHMPDKLVCGAGAWAQHLHLVRPRGGGVRIEPVPASRTEALLAAVEHALDGHGCPNPVPVWITETGIGDAPGGCQKMGSQLERWAVDGRVRAAFQYTLREDPVFPVGLADPHLTKLYPAYRAWRARGTTGC